MVTERTKTRLARVLRAEGLDRMADLAAKGRYDDFESESATPCIDLNRDLTACGRGDLAARARDGEWDGTPEESQAWADAQTDPEMRAILDSMGGKKP